MRPLCGVLLSAVRRLPVRTRARPLFVRRPPSAVRCPPSPLLVRRPPPAARRRPPSAAAVRRPPSAARRLPLLACLCETASTSLPLHDCLFKTASTVCLYKLCLCKPASTSLPLQACLYKLTSPQDPTPPLGSGHDVTQSDMALFASLGSGLILFQYSDQRWDTISRGPGRESNTRSWLQTTIRQEKTIDKCRFVPPKTVRGQ